MSRRRPCSCTHCQCRNAAQEPDIRQNPDGSLTQRAPASNLCVVCECVEIWGKNNPGYSGCKCTCKCRLQREDDSLLCGDCVEHNKLNPQGSMV
ncbi:hypothetical protein F4804DRAFT_335032 [Jackrogersella minutella]|nr:hypothetical protein F4804DRAFT_335032 [Jackrogersella minutella]